MNYSSEKNLPEMISGSEEMVARQQRYLGASWLCHLLADENGSVTLMLAGSLVGLLAFLALAIDVGQLQVAKQRLQMTADAAALAGALELGSCAGIANCNAMTTAMQDALIENNLPGSILLKNCAGNIAGALTLTVNNGPCALAAANPHNGNNTYVEAVISQPQRTFFAAVIGVRSVLITVRAEAALAGGGNCLMTLGKSGRDIFLNGSNVSMLNCGIIDNSSSGNALFVNGAQLVAKSIAVVGGSLINGGSVSPAPTTGIPPVTDPLAALPVPPFAAGGCLPDPMLNGSGNYTFAPSQTGGTVCYNGFTINGSETVSLAPGLYVIKGRLLLNGAVSLTGVGVTLYFPPGGSYQDNGGNTLNLQAPTAGIYNGILLYQNASDTQQILFNGTSASSIKGIVYAPGASVMLNGSSEPAFFTSFLVNSIMFNGSALLQDYSTINPSSPLASGAVLVQ